MSLVAGVALSCAMPAIAHADDVALASSTATPNVLFADLSLGVLGVAYERVLLDDFSLQVSLQYYRPWYVSDLVFGLGGELRAQFFVFGRAPEGLYLSPGLRVYWATLDEADAPEGIGVSFTGTLGYSFVAWDTLVLRLGVGPQVHLVDVAGGGAEPDFLGVYPIVDIFAGYAF